MPPPGSSLKRITTYSKPHLSRCDLNLHPSHPNANVELGKCSEEHLGLLRLRAQQWRHRPHSCRVTLEIFNLHGIPDVGGGAVCMRMDEDADSMGSGIPLESAPRRVDESGAIEMPSSAVA
ncbi:uncharacterized protein PG998_011168 [Apiospora kogelbergensis]|uniref:Uncharacterized protein n=1 Tax=Apiospora kogelbergensis TaxID=1337665 RepID=A0AAW0RCR0_9PEZI